MRFREPSPVDRFFETPAHERPGLDLDLPVSAELPELLRRVGSGVTRWADLVLGFAVDDASRQGIRPGQVSAALEQGDLSVQTFFFVKSLARESPELDQPRFGYKSDARLIGSLAARGSMLSVSGGEPIGLPFSMQYRKQDGAYLPARTTYVEIPIDADQLHLATIDVPETYAYTPEYAAYKRYKDIPNELRAASALGNYADLIEGELDTSRIAVRSTLSSTNFGEIRGWGTL